MGSPRLVTEQCCIRQPVWSDFTTTLASKCKVFSNLFEDFLSITWKNLVKCLHLFPCYLKAYALVPFWQIFEPFWQIFEPFWQIFEPFWQIDNAIGQILTALNGHNWTNHLVIKSFCIWASFIRTHSIRTDCGAPSLEPILLLEFPFDG